MYANCIKLEEAAKCMWRFESRMRQEQNNWR